jgi:hypothetical protein
VKRYAYVGPEAIRQAAVGATTGTAIGSLAALSRWLDDHRRDREAHDPGVPATFVIVDGELRIASRRSEHVACAGGHDVECAGEMFFAANGVVAVSNLSTGFCPEAEAWPAVAAALDRAGIAHSGGFTTAIVFRRCPACGERNVVKDDHFACALCDAELPAAWNF